MHDVKKHAEETIKDHDQSEEKVEHEEAFETKAKDKAEDETIVTNRKRAETSSKS